MSFIALKRMQVGEGVREPGQAVPEAADWKNTKKWEDWGYIIKESLFNPSIHLKGYKGAPQSVQKQEPKAKAEAVADVAPASEPEAPKKKFRRKKKTDNDE